MIKTGQLIRAIIVFLALSFLGSCASVKYLSVRRDINREIRKSSIFSSYFVGFALYDPENDKYIAEINADRYFTPASNTKILTLAAWLDFGRDSIPSFAVNVEGPYPLIQPLGDPTFLHPDFPHQPGIRQLTSLATDTLHIAYPDFNTDPYGPGWAWDDYLYGFQPERNDLPLYGNVVRVSIENNAYNINPPFFRNFINTTASETFRDRNYNLFNFSLTKYLGDSAKVDMPFVTSNELVETLLTDTLARTIRAYKGAKMLSTWDTIYNQHRLPVLAVMMQRSDNFLAEQLLINAQLSQGYGTLDDYIENVSAKLSGNLAKPLIWVDGSGLSRYNMVTPRSLISVLDGIHDKLSPELIKVIFPSGGASGTIKNWYGAETPYVYAKTGTLRHNHCLSGFLFTNSGKMLIFSFMNNHFPFSTAQVKTEMQGLLEAIRDNY